MDGEVGGVISAIIKWKLIFLGDGKFASLRLSSEQTFLFTFQFWMYFHIIWNGRIVYMISNPTPKYLYTNQCHTRPSPFICKKRRYNIDTENGGRNIFVGLAAPSSLLIRLSTLMLDIACLFVCCFGCLLFVGLFVGFFTNAYHGMAVWFSLLKENFIVTF